jgi:hypothetical protein
VLTRPWNLVEKWCHALNVASCHQNSQSGNRILNGIAATFSDVDRCSFFKQRAWLSAHLLLCGQTSSVLTKKHQWIPRLSHLIKSLRLEMSWVISGRVKYSIFNHVLGIIEWIPTRYNAFTQKTNVGDKEKQETRDFQIAILSINIHCQAHIFILIKLNLLYIYLIFFYLFSWFFHCRNKWWFMEMNMYVHRWILNAYRHRSIHWRRIKTTWFITEQKIPWNPKDKNVDRGW